MKAQRALMVLLIVGAFFLALTGYGVIQQGQSIREQRGVLARQQEQLAQLVQQLCDNLSASRLATNHEIRQPLKGALMAIAAILNQAADLNPEPKRARNLRRSARQFETLAAQVHLVGRIKCQFAEAFGTNGKPSGPDGPGISLPGGLLTIRPSAGPPTVIRIPAGSTFVPSPSPTPSRSPPHLPSPSPTCHHPTPSGHCPTPEPQSPSPTPPVA